MGKSMITENDTLKPLPIAELKRICKGSKMVIEGDVTVTRSPMDPALRALCDEMYPIMTPSCKQQTARNAALVHLYVEGLMEGKWGVINEITESQMMAASVIFYTVVGHYAFDEIMDRLKPALVCIAFKTSKKHIMDVIETAQRAARSNAATRAALASHDAHRSNKQKARDWYAEHKTMTKDAAAEKMWKGGIVHASFRTIRGYLTGQ